MSYLLDSGKVGTLDKSRNTNSHIFVRWKELGFLDGLDEDTAMKVALSYEIAANMMLMDGKIYDMYFKINEDIIDDDGIVDTVIFPIIRRIVSKFVDAHKYVPEIVNMVKKEFETSLWKSIASGSETAIAHFYDNVLPIWSSHHKERKHKDYHDFKKYMYKRHVEKCREYRRNIESYEDFIPIDLEAEFCAYVAERIENIIREYERVN